MNRKKSKKAKTKTKPQNRRKAKNIAGSRPDIAYQNKDIESKLIGEGLVGKSFNAYGLNLPKIKASFPTNLPAVEANELRLDQLFEFEGDELFGIVDYESDYSEAKKSKYMEYFSRVEKRLYAERGHYCRLKLIIIYTADIKRGMTSPDLDMDGMNMHLTEVFLTDLNSEEIRNRIKGKLDRGEKLDDKDLMQLIIYPLTYSGRKMQEEAVSEAIELAEKIDDDMLQRHILSGILVFSDKVIRKEDSDHIRRKISMTKIGRMIWEEGWEEGIKEGEEKGIKKGWEEGIKEGKEAGIKEGKEAGIKEGIKEGEEKTYLESIRNLMSNLKLSAEQAMEALGIKKELRAEFIANL